MPVTVIATAGAANANAYCTLLEAEAYHETHPYASTWTGADDAKNRAIVTATRLLDEHVEWHGVVATQTQALAWPRAGMVDRNGIAILSTVVPQGLKDATAELARVLIEGNRMADNEIETQGISQLKAGPVYLAFQARVVAKVLSDSVYFMIRQWGTVRRRNPEMSSTVRG